MSESHEVASDPSVVPVPTITLGGTVWNVPKLAPKQNRVLIPMLLEIIPKIETARASVGDELAKMAALITTENYDKLCAISYTALTRANALTRAEFDDLPIDTTELIVAIPLIASQAGLSA